MRLVAALLAFACCLRAGTASALAEKIRGMSIDPNECYRVRDLTIVREDIRLYLTDGYLAFATPLANGPVVAAFTTEVEGGDAEVLLLPPDRSERRSLATYIGTPNLNEHFKGAVFVFSDDTYSELVAQLRERDARKVPEMGALMEQKWTPVARNLAASFETRLVLDLLSGAGRERGFFAAAISSPKFGSFDVQYDLRSHEQIIVGQVTSRETRAYFDVWTSFPSASVRSRKRPNPAPEFTLSDFRIEAAIDQELRVSGVTRVRVKPSAPLPVLPFDISGRMRVTSAKVDGAPAEILMRDSMRGNLRNNGNVLFLVTPTAPLQPGRTYELEFRHEGEVILPAGNRVYFVTARVNWYPNRGLQFATYDLTFRYPKELDLVATGEQVEEKTEGAWRITRRRTTAPVRLAGFNLGVYERIQMSRTGYNVEVYGTLPDKPAERGPLVLPATPTWTGRPQRRQDMVLVPADLPPLPPPTRLRELASEVTSALEFMAARMGPLPLKTLTVAPVPGAFGQGFPGLIYLSHLAYLSPKAKEIMALPSRQQVFFADILQAHETAHQWWGNVVTAYDYHDGWLMEALANYSALMYLEKRKGPRALDAALDEYRDALLAKADTGTNVDATGPIVMGQRLETSAAPQSWRAITYGKGSWIIHMVRRLTGDDAFSKLLAELRRKYEWNSISTEDFRRAAARFLPPKSPDPQLEAFFDQWVYGTGIPSLRLSWSVKGARLTGTVAQSDVDEQFSASVPVEIQFASGKPVTHWVRTSAEPAGFQLTLRQRPVKVLLDPNRAVLRR